MRLYISQAQLATVLNKMFFGKHGHFVGNLAWTFLTPLAVQAYLLSHGLLLMSPQLSLSFCPSESDHLVCANEPLGNSQLPCGFGSAWSPVPMQHPSVAICPSIYLSNWTWSSANVASMVLYLTSEAQHNPEAWLDFATQAA